MKKNIIYNENCNETFTKIKDKSIDGVITSPPYNIILREAIVTTTMDIQN